MSARPRLGPTAKAALAAPIEGKAKRQLLALLAINADLGRTPWPSVREMARAVDVTPGKVVRVLDKLEAEGHISVHQRPARHERASYEVHVGGQPDPHHQTRGINMPTKTITEREGLLAAKRRAGIFRADYLPELELAVWPLWRDLRATHNAAVEALQAAEATGGEDDEAAALGHLIDVANELIATLPSDLAGAEAALSEAETKTAARHFGSGMGTSGLTEAERLAIEAEADAEQAEFQQRIRALLPKLRHDAQEIQSVWLMAGAKLQVARGELARVQIALRGWESERRG